ncbi:related to RNA polymerase I-specific transcription initiation factor RRN11 [Zygosaccharomyces bailii]|nr:related to RNA polymerase I-specific transcription initiation factor RRN11 [Zygosaccharomyces bailii]
MFEIPVVSISKCTRTSRKLKYQYINNLTRKYDSINGISSSHRGLPTPENSATEISENEEAVERKKKRTRRRWKSIIGDSYSDSESDEDLTMDDTDNEERKFYKRYEKPQATFEKWHRGPKRRVPIQRNRITYSTLKRIQKYGSREVENSRAIASKSSKIYFDAVSQGYQVFDPTYGRANTFQLKHIDTLTGLLHLNVSRKKWVLAYKCFALLIRIPGVDVRTLWGLGERILAEKQPTRSLEFLQWMSNVYSSKLPFVEDINYRMAPVFTKGSKTHTPKYTTVWLWECLVRYANELEDPEMEQNAENNLQSLMERISEMVLGPPYMDDPEVWFIYALCHMVKADVLSQRFNPNITGSLRDIASSQIIQHVQCTKSYLQRCSEKGDFGYPKRYIGKRLAAFEARLNPVEDGGYYIPDQKPGENDGFELYPENMDTQSVDFEMSSSD